MLNLLNFFLGKYWIQRVAKCNKGVKEEYKISRTRRSERGVAKTNADVLIFNGIDQLVRHALKNLLI